MPPQQGRPDYSRPVNFRKLAEQDEEFAAVTGKQGVVDWQNAKAVKQLTKSLLKRDFGLTVEVPDDRLCPPVPNRYLYVRFIQRLIDATSKKFKHSYDRDRQVLGVDIGIGSSCIYPLLAVASRPTWSMFGTDIDRQNLENAHHNVELNNLSSHIRLHQSDPRGKILPLEDMKVSKADFCMCNPPFYSSREEMAFSTLKKTAKPNAVCTGAHIEMITEGGELAFARKMLRESLVLGDRIQWYSIMFGKLESLGTFVSDLRERECSNWALAVLAPGTQTKRWAIAWSWMGFRPSMRLVRPEANFPSHMGKAIFAFPSTSTFSFSKDDHSKVSQRLQQALSSLAGERHWEEGEKALFLKTSGNVWARKARRKQKALEHGGYTAHAPDGMTDANNDGSGNEMGFVVKVKLTQDAVEVYWLFGLDSSVMESFCGFVRRTMDTT